MLNNQEESRTKLREYYGTLINTCKEMNVSREKIAHELIRLKTELKKAKSIDGNYEKLRRNNHNFQKPNNSSGFQLPPTVPRDMPSSLVAYGQLLPSKRQSSTITPNPTLRNYLEPIK